MQTEPTTTTGQDLQVDTFEAFVRRVEPRVRAALVGRYGPEGGREAAAEAMAYAWEHREAVTTMESPAGYLIRVGRSSQRRWCRPDARAWRFDIAESAQVEPEPGLSRALARLSARQREVVLLCVGLGHTQDEVARDLSLSRSAVQVHLRRALSKLRTEMGATDEF